MIHFQKKIIYIARPKTGSATLRNILEQAGFQSFENLFGRLLILKVCNILHMHFSCLDHINLHVIKKCLEIKFPKLKLSNFYIFTTIRNPWDKLTSAYRYTVEYFRTEHTFESYISKALKMKIFSLEYMCFDGSNDGCNEYIDMNDIGSKVKNLLSRFDIQIKNEVFNKKLMETKKSMHYRMYYNEVNRKLVNDVFKYEIDRFGYSF